MQARSVGDQPGAQDGEAEPRVNGSTQKPNERTRDSAPSLKRNRFGVHNFGFRNLLGPQEKSHPHQRNQHRAKTDESNELEKSTASMNGIPTINGGTANHQEIRPSRASTVAAMTDSVADSHPVTQTPNSVHLSSHRPSMSAAKDALSPFRVDEDARGIGSPPTFFSTRRARLSFQHHHPHQLSQPVDRSVDGKDLISEDSLERSKRTLGSVLPTSIKDEQETGEDGEDVSPLRQSSGGSRDVWSSQGDVPTSIRSQQGSHRSWGFKQSWGSKDKPGSEEKGSLVFVEGKDGEASGDDPSEVASEAPASDDAASVSEDTLEGGVARTANVQHEHICGGDFCMKERKRLRKKVEELKIKLSVSDETIQKYMTEILDLRNQVSMLSGFELGRSGAQDGQYHSNYDVLSSESGGAKPAPFQGHRIKHQRINPALIIKEKDIVIEKIVGVGSFGKVWKGIYDGRPVAIKCFYSEDADVIGEINLMERVNGKAHVLPLEGVYLSNDTGEEAQVALVTPFMENGSLHDVLVNVKSPQYRASISMNAIVRIAMQTADGVRSLHQENVIHRDLACRNILVDGKLDVYVSDFGFARQKENKSSKGFTKNNMGPVKWEAPESLQRKEYSEKTDAFSFAVCCYEMVTGREPWEDETHAQVAYQVICGNRLPVALNCDPVLAELMQLCWDGDSRKRPNFEYIFRRLKERHIQLQNEEREVSGEKQLVHQLRQGATFHKLPYLKGKPHKRQFKVSEDLRRLKWFFLPTRNFMQRARDPVRPATKQVFLGEVQDIRMGMRTANFRRIEHYEKFRGRSAFSIICQDRTIDILCPTSELMDQWVLGLRFLVDRLRPPPASLPTSSIDRHTLMSRLRRGGLLLKFGQIGRPHERYFRVSANMRLLLWTSGEAPGKAVHKSVDLSTMKALVSSEVRLFRNVTPNVAVFAPAMHVLSKGVDDLQFGFSLVNIMGQTDINLVAGNVMEFYTWTRGLELVIRYFQQHQEGTGGGGEEENGADNGAAIGEEPPPVYDRGDYLKLEMADIRIGPGLEEEGPRGREVDGVKWRPMNRLIEGEEEEEEAEEYAGEPPLERKVLSRGATLLAGTGDALRKEAEFGEEEDVEKEEMERQGQHNTVEDRKEGHVEEDAEHQLSPSLLGMSARSVGKVSKSGVGTDGVGRPTEVWSPLSQLSSFEGIRLADARESGEELGSSGGYKESGKQDEETASVQFPSNGGEMYASGAALLHFLEEEGKLPLPPPGPSR